MAENRVLRSQVAGRVRLSDTERSTLAEIGKRLGREYLAVAACVAKPNTILAWYRRLIARKVDGSKHRVFADVLKHLSIRISLVIPGVLLR